MSVYAIYFSPTRSTEKIVKLLAKEFGSYGEIDLSKQNSGENVRAFKEDDICVFGVPSYGGRVPAPALERMKKNERESCQSGFGGCVRKQSL